MGVWNIRKQGESLKGGSFCEEKVEPPVDRSKTKTEGKGKRGKEGGASGAAPLSFFLPPLRKNKSVYTLAMLATPKSDGKVIAK